MKGPRKVKSKRKQMLVFVGLGVGVKKDTMYSGFHELIRLADVAPFLPTGVNTGEV